MTMKDVIKGKVYEQIAGGTGISIKDILLILGLSCVIGVYIFFVYKRMSKAAFYSKDLNMTIAGMVVVVAAIMIAMQSSLIVSLGMVGALSIVRFRSAVKNPLDLLYLFWAVSSGILCGVGLSILVIVLCIIMTLMLMLLGLIPNSKPSMLLVLRGGEVDWNRIKELVKKNCKYYKEKSESITKSETELIIEIECSDSDSLMMELKGIDSLSQINLLSHDGEYRI